MAKTQSPLKERFNKKIAPKLMKELGIDNLNAVPKLQKVVVNAGLGSMYTAGNKDFTEFEENFKAMTGQKPVVKNAKKAISNFKIRQGMPNGVMVTLRGDRMYDFIEKLVNIVFPRVRDFRGISPKSFDGKGNYSVGLKEHIVFPEINPDDIVKIHGLQICVNTTAENDEHGRALLTELGFPFKKSAAPKEQSSMEVEKATEAKKVEDKEAPGEDNDSKDDLPGESMPKTIESVEVPDNEEPEANEDSSEEKK